MTATESRKKPAAKSSARFAVLVVVLMGTVTAGAWAAWKAFGPTPVSGMRNGELVHEVTRGDLLISFSERGNVRSASSVPIYCRLEGKSTIVSVVADGEHVNEGDLLAELDSSQLQQELNQQQISVDNSEADYRAAEEQVKIQESLNRSTIQKGELAVLLAEIDLRKYQEGDWPLSLEKAKADIFIAEEERARAETEHEWTRKLAEKGYVSLTELRADQLAVEKAKVQETQARGQLRVLEEFTRQKELETYRSALQQATDALERSKREADAEMAKVLATHRGKRSTYELSKQRLEKLQDQIAKTKIYAPQAGMVVYEQGEGRRETRVIEAGADVFENQLLMKLPDVDSMAVDVQIHEAWIDQITEGQAALVSIDALPHLNLNARVSKVGVLPDQVNRWLNPDLKVYKTELVIEAGSESRLLKPGMSARVQILVRKLQDVVFVPVQSVTTIDKQQVVYVWTGREFESRPVVCGSMNESFVEVKSGVEPGTLIRLSAPPPQGGSHFEEIPEFEEVEKKKSGSRGPESFANPGNGERGGPGAEDGKGPGGEGRRRPAGGAGGEGRRSPGSGDGAGRGKPASAGAEDESPADGGGSKPRRAPRAEGQANEPVGAPKAKSAPAPDATP